jgi:hypothetical protein
VDPYGDSLDYGRLIEMVLAAQDFGLEPMDARAIAMDAIENTETLSDSCEWAAAALAERILANVRRDVAADSRR